MELRLIEKTEGGDLRWLFWFQRGLSCCNQELVKPNVGGPAHPISLLSKKTCEIYG
jgi:hypothetical protein